MSVKVKRGLGLLVIAVVALLVGLIAQQSDTITTAQQVATAASSVVLVTAGACGLVLVVWGLLRD